MFVKRPKESFPPGFLCFCSHSAGLLLSSAPSFLPLQVCPLSPSLGNWSGFMFCDSPCFLPVFPFPHSFFCLFALSLSCWRCWKSSGLELILHKLIRLQVAFTPAGKRSQHCRELDGLFDTDHLRWLYNLQHKALRRGNWKTKVKKIRKVRVQRERRSREIERKDFKTQPKWPLQEIILPSQFDREVNKKNNILTLVHFLISVTLQNLST